MTNEESTNLGRQCLYAFILGLAIIFCFMVHMEVIHPYPTQYRIITNGNMYKIQEKNWFLPWMTYKERDSCWDEKEVFKSCRLARAKEKLAELERSEKNRMILKNSGKMKPSPWKPLDKGK